MNITMIKKYVANFCNHFHSLKGCTRSDEL